MIKLAFCFLTYNDLVRFDIWNFFFKNADSTKYNIYIHPKTSENFTSKLEFQYYTVKDIIFTKSKSDISIVNATLKLLENAFNQDSDNTYFIFLTQSCIPLYNFDTLYKIITQFPNSVLSYIEGNRIERYNQLENRFKKLIHPNLFVKQQPNMIIIRDDVQLFLNNDYTLYFKHMVCPDEHYFINILIHVFKKKIIKKQVNFCNYDLQKTQALEFNNINEELIKKIRSYGFLFMRKALSQSIINIHNLLYDENKY